jgi:hypothetical protein
MGRYAIRYFLCSWCGLLPGELGLLLGGLRNGGAGSIQVKAEKTDYLDARRGMAVFSLDVPDKG